MSGLKSYLEDFKFLTNEKSLREAAMPSLSLQHKNKVRVGLPVLLNKNKMPVKVKPVVATTPSKPKAFEDFEFLVTGSHVKPLAEAGEKYGPGQTIGDRKTIRANAFKKREVVRQQAAQKITQKYGPQKSAKFAVKESQEAQLVADIKAFQNGSFVEGLLRSSRERDLSEGAPYIGGAGIDSLGLNQPGLNAQPKSSGDRPISTIAREIFQDWKKVNYAAKPYLDAMLDLNKITDNYMQDSGASVVAYFLSNASSWKGEVAKRVKKELNAMLKKAYGH